MNFRLIIFVFAMLFVVPLIPAGFSNVDDAHSAATEYMLSLTSGPTGDSDRIPIMFSAVNGSTVVIGINANALLGGTTYTESQIQDLLNTTASIDIRYMTFTTESASENTSFSPIEMCYPVLKGFEDACDEHFEDQINLGILPPNYNWKLEQLALACFPTIQKGFELECKNFYEEISSSAAGAGDASGQSSSDPCDDDANSLACYFYPRYISQCLPTPSHSSCDTFASIILGAGYTLPTSPSTPAPPASDTTRPTIRAPIDILLHTNTQTPRAINLGTATASDNSGSVTITNNAPSLFPVGTTQVIWTATDPSGNTARDYQSVTIIYVPPSVPNDNVIFSDTFASGLNQWVLSGDELWETGIFAESYNNPPRYLVSDIVAQSDDCDDYCIMTSIPIDLSGYASATLEFGRYLDNSLDNDEGLQVELYNGNTWSEIFHWTDNGNDDDDTWHVESYDLRAYIGTSDFKIRFTADSSRSNESVGLNNVMITGIGATAPVANPDPVSVPPGSDLFSDTFDSGLSQWIISGDGRWITGDFDESQKNPPLYSSSDIVASSKDCDEHCIITSPSIILRNQDWAYLEFGRYIDNGLDDDEGLKVELYDGLTWTAVYHWTEDGNHDDDTWRVESYNLSEYLNSNNFKVRFTAKSNTYSEEVAINNFRIIVPPIQDNTNPRITAPADITIQVDIRTPTSVDLGDAIASDNSGDVSVTNNAPLLFPVGTTRVTWTATDPSGNTARDYQTVTVSYVASDGIPPTIVAPADVSVETDTDAPASVDIGNAVATDDSGSVRITNNAPSLFPVGTTIVIWTATDDAGNTSTDTQTITVTYVAPVIQSRFDDRILSGGDVFDYVYVKEGKTTVYHGDSGTITIGATKDGQRGLVTAAHVIVRNDTAPLSLQQIRESHTGELIAQFEREYTIADYTFMEADTAFIPITTNYTLPTNTLVDHNDQYINIVNRGGLHLSQNTEINMINSTHTMPGIITFLNVTIRDHVDRDTHSNTGQIVGDWSSSPGNSGSPIITVPENGQATLVGLHVGKLCQYYDWTGSNFDWIPKDVCHDSWKVLSPWEGIDNVLDLDE